MGVQTADIVCITEYNILHIWEIRSDIFVARQVDRCIHFKKDLSFLELP